MDTRTELDKLRILLPHWIKHNDEHAVQFREWAEKTRQADQVGAARDIWAASEALIGANQALTAALETLGGPLDHHRED